MDTEIAEVLERLTRIEARLAAPAKEYLSVDEASDFIGVSKVLLDEWRSRGGGPAYHKMGRRVLYSVVDLRSFAAGSRVEALR